MARATGFEERLQAVYLPFWSFSFRARSQWSARIGEHWWREEPVEEAARQDPRAPRVRRIQETEWYPLSGVHHADYVGFALGAGRGLPDAELRRIQPFRVEGMKPYDPAYLVGWSSEEAVLRPEDARPMARAMVEEEQRLRVAAFLPGDCHAGLEVETRLEPVAEALMLAPVFLVSYRYAGTVYRYLLNGQTGKAAGDRPVAWRRVLAAGLSAAVLLAAVLLGMAASGRGP
jgi:hypothetical protein